MEVFGAYLVMYYVPFLDPKVVLFPVQSNISFFFLPMLFNSCHWIGIVHSRMAVLDFINVIVDSLAVKKYTFHTFEIFIFHCTMTMHIR
jgi:hypothetical protein